MSKGGGVKKRPGGKKGTGVKKSPGGKKGTKKRAAVK